MINMVDTNKNRNEKKRERESDDGRVRIVD
jgi:hypothetical protein